MAFLRPVIGLLAGVLLLASPGPAGAAGTAAGSAAPSDDRRGASVQERKLPPRDQWLADVKTAMKGSRAYVREQVAAGVPHPAINFDIDNTVIATYYDGGGAIPQMRRFARFLDRKGVAMVFNTGRRADQRRSTRRQLDRTGFPVAALCLRAKGETLPAGKQRCRDRFARAGWALIANVGNNDTDFVGDGYGRAFVLPNYDGVLG